MFYKKFFFQIFKLKISTKKNKIKLLGFFDDLTVFKNYIHIYYTKNETSFFKIIFDKEIYENINIKY
jgi:hypothetical protein